MVTGAKKRAILKEGEAKGTESVEDEPEMDGWSLCHCKGEQPHQTAEQSWSQ